MQEIINNGGTRAQEVRVRITVDKPLAAGQLLDVLRNGVLIGTAIKDTDLEYSILDSGYGLGNQVYTAVVQSASGTPATSNDYTIVVHPWCDPVIVVYEDIQDETSLTHFCPGIENYGDFGLNIRILASEPTGSYVIKDETGALTGFSIDHTQGEETNQNILGSQLIDWWASIDGWSFQKGIFTLHRPNGDEAAVVTAASCYVPS